jgi:hypothetical protein
MCIEKCFFLWSCLLPLHAMERAGVRPQDPFKASFSTFKSFKKVVDELKRKIDLICSG